MSEAGSDPRDGVEDQSETRRKRNVLIMRIADSLLPWITEQLEGVEDKSGRLVRPSTIRAIAHNVARNLLKESENEDDTVASINEGASANEVAEAPETRPEENSQGQVVPDRAKTPVNGETGTFS
jgi:hypothetical protein